MTLYCRIAPAIAGTAMPAMTAASAPTIISSIDEKPFSRAGTMRLLAEQDAFRTGTCWFMGFPRGRVAFCHTSITDLGVETPPSARRARACPAEASGEGGRAGAVLLFCRSRLRGMLQELHGRRFAHRLSPYRSMGHARIG